MSHYFDKKQTSVLKREEISAVIRSAKYDFISGSGTFSIRAVDAGTKLIANKAMIQDDWDVLDLGCGYGVIGIVIANEFPNTNVIMSDINSRAVLLASENIEKYNLKNIKAIQSDLFKKMKEKKFDTIVCNPPYAAGRQLTFDMITQSKEHLKQNGLLQMVFRHQKGGKAVMEKMNEIFGNVKDIAKKSGYRIYVSANI